MHPFGRGEILGLAIPDIGFGRSHIGPVRSGLDSNSGYVRRVRSDTRCSVFLQEFLDDALDFAVIALPKVVVPDSPFRVDEILGGPILVIERLPDRRLAVDGHRKSNIQIAHGILYVYRFVLERKLRRVHSDHYKARIIIFRRPASQVWQWSNGVDAGVSPEINEGNFSAKRLAAQGNGIEPADGAIQVRHGAFVAE